MPLDFISRSSGIESLDLEEGGRSWLNETHITIANFTSRPQLVERLWVQGMESHLGVNHADYTLIASSPPKGLTPISTTWALGFKPGIAGETQT